MANMSVSMTENMREKVKARMVDGDFNNESEYIRDLIRRDLEHSDIKAEFLELMKNAIESGISELSMSEIKQKAIAKLAANK